MTRTFVLALALASAAALPAFAPLADELRFAPEVGSSLEKTYATKFHFELDDLTVLVDGEDVIGTFGMPTMRFDIDSRVRVVDRYLAVADGRPTKLERHFDGLKMNVDMEAGAAGELEQNQVEVGSRLEGKRVLFTWNEQDQDYDVTWAPDHSGPSDLLSGLREDMDLRALLPTGGVREGDTWNLTTAALMTLFASGGDVAWESEADEEEFQKMMAGFTERITTAIEQQLKGARTATFTGIREADGRRLGVIELDIDMDLDFDMSAMMREMLTQLPEQISVNLSRARIRYNGTMQGEALWDIAAGVAHALAVSGDIEAELDIAGDIAAMGEKTTFDVTGVVSGNQRIDLTTSRR